jgi:hypothetical protein
MFDRRDYAAKLRSRVAGYCAEGLANVLVTTGDLAGLRHDRLLAVIDDIVTGKIAGGPAAREFSNHHYTL